MQECAVMNVRASKTPGTPGRADENCANSVGSSLTDQEKSKFRGVAARINYLAQDRADLQFAAQDLCRRMASPQVHDWEKGEKNRKVFEREAEGNPALRIWKDCAAAGWFSQTRIGLANVRV